MPDIPRAVEIAQSVAPIADAVGTAVGAGEAVRTGLDIVDELHGNKGKRGVIGRFIHGKDSGIPPNQKRPEVARQSDVIESGSPEREINLNVDAKRLIVERLIKRAAVARDLRDKQRPLTVVDKMVLREDFLDRVKAGDLTKEDVALAWYELQDELLIKQMATARLIANLPGRLDSLRDIPLIGRLARDPRTAHLDWINPDTGNPISDTEFSSYIREINYDRWGPENIRKDLENINRLVIQLEKSFYEHGFKNPWSSRLAERIRTLRSGSLYHPPIRGDVSGLDDQFGNEYRHRLTNELSLQIEPILAERIRTGVVTLPQGSTTLTLEDLYRTNPLEAVKVMHEATQNALAQKAREYALKIVSGEGYSGDAAAIRQRATELRQPVTPEDLTPLQEASTRATEEADQAKRKVSALQKELKELRDERADEQGNTIPSKLTIAQREEDEADQAETNFMAKNGNYEIPPPPAPGAAAAPAVISGRFQEILQDIQDYDAFARDPATPARNQQNAFDHITTLRTEFNQLRERLEALRVEHQRKTNERLRIAARITALTAVSVPPAVPSAGSIQEAEEAFQASNQRAKTAKDRFDEASGSTGEKGKEEMAKAEDRWAIVAGNRPLIHSINYSQQHGGEFTLDKLSDASITTDGQVAGAETIRRLIFQTVDKKGFSPEMMVLSRKMLSDETLARIILEDFDVPLNAIVSQPLPPGIHGPARTATFEQMLNWLEHVKNQYEAETNPVRKQGFKKNMELRQRTILTHAISRLTHVHQMRIASFINTIVDRGVASAELGNPYLTMVR